MSPAGAPPSFAKAVLIPMNGDQVETDPAKHIPVQFNPSTLRVTLANTLHADSGGGRRGRRPAAQYVEKSESSLAVELVFDTSVAQQGTPANSDVRALTGRIAPDLPQAKALIDVAGSIAETIRPQLDPEDQRQIDNLVRDLRGEVESSTEGE